MNWCLQLSKLPKPEVLVLFLCRNGSFFFFFFCNSNSFLLFSTLFTTSAIIETVTTSHLINFSEIQIYASSIPNATLLGCGRNWLVLQGLRQCLMYDDAPAVLARGWTAAIHDLVLWLAITGFPVANSQWQHCQPRALEVRKSTTVTQKGKDNHSTKNGWGSGTRASPLGICTLVLDALATTALVILEVLPSLLFCLWVFSMAFLGLTSPPFPDSSSSFMQDECIYSG